MVVFQTLWINMLELMMILNSFLRFHTSRSDQCERKKSFGRQTDANGFCIEGLLTLLGCLLSQNVFVSLPKVLCQHFLKKS